MIWAEMTNQQRSGAVMHMLPDGGTRAFNRPPKPPREARSSRERKPRPIAIARETSPFPIDATPIDATPIGKYDAAFQALPGTSPVALTNLEKDQCRWPIDADGRTLFCGCGVVENKSYCAVHNEMGRAKPEVA